MLKMNYFNHWIFLVLCVVFSSNTMACETQVESYVAEYHLASDFENLCDGYGDCMDPAKLVEEAEKYSTYEVFVFFGNSGGYPSDTKFIVTVDKTCNVTNVVE